MKFFFQSLIIIKNFKNKKAQVQCINLLEMNKKSTITEGGPAKMTPQSKNKLLEIHTNFDPSIKGILKYRKKDFIVVPELYPERMSKKKKLRASRSSSSKKIKIRKESFQIKNFDSNFVESFAKKHQNFFAPKNEKRVRFDISESEDSDYESESVRSVSTYNNENSGICDKSGKIYLCFFV